jgi:hypothetical protein
MMRKLHHVGREIDAARVMPGDESRRGLRLDVASEEHVPATRSIMRP